MHSILKQRTVISWSLYELAETALHALYFTFFWPLYIQEHLGGTEFHVGLAVSASLLAVAFLVPFIGAFTDAWGRRMPILIISTLLTAVAVALTGYVELSGALILGACARVLLSIDDDLYSAKLPDIAPKNAIGLISGLGVGVGYIGTIIALAVAYPILEHFGWETEAAIRAMFWQAALFIIIFSLPLFFLVKDPPGRGTVNTPTLKTLSAKAVHEMKKTVHIFKRFNALPRFLLASFIYNDAVHTTLIFFVLFSREVVGVSIQEFLFAFAVMAVGSAFGAFGFGKLSDSTGPKYALSIALIGWVCVIVFLLFDPSYSDLLLAGTVGGVMLGGIWTLNRHVLVSLAPLNKMGELMGIEGFIRRSSGVVGSITVGAVITWVGYTAGLLLILFLFLAGLALLQLMPTIPAVQRDEGRLDL